MGEVHVAMQQYDDAWKFFGKALKREGVVASESDDSSLETVILHKRMGKACQDQKQFDKALEYYNKALDIYIGLQREHHSHTGDLYDNMARVYKAQGSNLLEYFGKALGIKLATEGVNQRSLPETCKLIREVCVSQDQLEQVLANAVRRAADINSSHSVAKHYQRLGLAFQKQELNNEALKCYDKAMVGCLESKRENHPDTGDLYDNMARACQKQDSNDKALEYFGKALNIKLATVGEKDPSVTAIYSLLGELHVAMKQYEKASEWFDKTLINQEGGDFNTSDLKEAEVYNRNGKGMSNREAARQGAGILQQGPGHLSRITSR